MNNKKEVVLSRDLKTGDMIYLDDGFLRYDDENITIKQLKKLEPRILKVKREDIIYIYRYGRGRIVDKKISCDVTTKYVNGLKFNSHFKEECRKKEISK